jgi:hypothetical protein
MVRPERFELPTYCSGGNRSIHLSYGRTLSNSVYIEAIAASIVTVRRTPQAQRSSAKRRPRAGAVRTRSNFKPRILKLPPASSTATAAPATTVPATISAPPAAVASAASCVLGLGTRLVHVECATADLRTIQCGDGLLSIFIAGHFHKAEAARAPGIAVRHDADPVDLPERFKHLPQFVFRCVKAQVADKNILQASSSALSCRSASWMRRDWQVGNTFLKIETGAGEQSNAGRSIAGLCKCTIKIEKSAGCALTDLTSGGTSAAKVRTSWPRVYLAFVYLPISFALISNPQQAILRIVPLAAVRADQIPAPSRPLVIVVLRNRKSRPATAWHQKHS